MGDFNMPKVDWELMCSNVAREDDYINIIDSYGLTACINEATHLKGNVLDNLLTTELDICASVVRIINSDHSSISFSIDHSAIPISTHTYSIHRFTDASCSEFARVVNLFYLDPCKPIDCSVDEFLVHLKYSMDACFDHRRRKRTFLPFYYSSHSVHLYNKMQTLIRRNNTQMVDYPNHLHRIQREFSESVDLDKVVFTNNFKKCTISECFATIKGLSGSSKLPAVMSDGVSTFSSNYEKCIALNKIFASNFNSEVIHIPAVSYHEPDIHLDEVCFTQEEITKLLGTTPASKSKTADRLSGKILHVFSDVLGPYFYILFGLIISTATFPAIWMIAHVMPIHESGDKALLRNYRSISLLSRASLVLERVIFNFLYPKIAAKLSSK
ncbi:MAG: hypothetical protein AAFR14_12395, partial [Bacteroidota bacterium]